MTPLKVFYKDFHLINLPSTFLYSNYFKEYLVSQASIYSEHQLVFSGHRVAACKNRSIFDLFIIWLLPLYVIIHIESVIILLLLFLVQILSGFDCHFVKIVRIRSFCSPYFPTFGLNTERYSLSLKTPNMDTFRAMCN